MLRTACVVALLLAVAGCTGAATSDEKPAAVSTQLSTLGACRLLTPADIDHASNASPTVDCSRRHTAETFAVGTFPAAVAAKGTSSGALGAYVYGQCRSKFRHFVGADDSLALRSVLTWAWFRPPKASWDAGGHTWRCDVIGGSGKSAPLLTLPASAKGLLLGRPDDRWMVCVNGATVNGAPKIPCSEPHTWRAVTTIVLGKPKDPYLGDRLSEVRTRDYCSDSVGAWMNYPVDYDFGYTWFHAAEWKAGNRRSICWAKTDQ